MTITIEPIGNTGIDLNLCPTGKILHDEWCNLSRQFPTERATHKAMAVYFYHKNGNGILKRSH